MEGAGGVWGDGLDEDADVCGWGDGAVGFVFVVIVAGF